MCDLIEWCQYAENLEALWWSCHSHIICVSWIDGIFARSIGGMAGGFLTNLFTRKFILESHSERYFTLYFSAYFQPNLQPIRPSNVNMSCYEESNINFRWQFAYNETFRAVVLFLSTTVLEFHQPPPPLFGVALFNFDHTSTRTRFQT